MPACKLIFIETRQFSGKDQVLRFPMPFHNVDDIAEKGWSRSNRLRCTSRRDTLNFHVRLHAWSVTATCRWFCAPLVYQIESIGLVREAWRVLVILKIHVRHVIAFHYPIEHTYRAVSTLLTKNFDPTWPLFRTIFGRRIDQRQKKTPVSHRRRRFAVVNNCS